MAHHETDIGIATVNFVNNLFTQEKIEFKDDKLDINFVNQLRISFSIKITAEKKFDADQVNKFNLLANEMINNDNKYNILQAFFISKVARKVKKGFATITIFTGRLAKDKLKTQIKNNKKILYQKNKKKNE